MRRERRLIWCEDRYQLLGQDGLDRYYGRTKGDFFVVYRKRGDSVRRAIVQVVEAELDWFWDSISNRLVAEESVTEISVTENSNFDLSTPYEHVLRGYANSNRIENLTHLSSLRACSEESARVPMQELEMQLGSGAQARFLLPGSEISQVREWVISLHGGPESYEGTEIRYGGLYRELLRQGTGIAILNYRGSTGVVKPDSISWKSSIESDFDSLIGFLKPAKPVSVLGASFGGALTLLLSQTRRLEKVLLISPLLDLVHQRGRGGEDFRSWFDSKFSMTDFENISLRSLARDLTNSTTPITLIHGAQDEVLGQEMFEWLSVVLRMNARHAVYTHGGPHQPVSYRDVTSQLLWAFEFLTSPAERPPSPPFGTLVSGDFTNSL